MAKPRRRRVARYISPVDQERLEKGLTPSWQEGPGDGVSLEDDKKGGGNDQRLLAEIPPHHHAHLR
ncbi:toxin [Actinomycetaceae bacterium TAE3-ERU4]|nr:toxin [Actinomycetaceae bacterium TAE3-ERU4]